MSLLKIAKSGLHRNFSSVIRETAPTFSSFHSISRCATTALLKTNGTSQITSKATQPDAKVSHSAAVTTEDVSSSTHCRGCKVYDREAMVDFMCNSFVTREPLMKTLGATPTNAKKYVAYCVDRAIEQRASFLAIDEETGNICGLRLNEIGPSDGEELKQDFGMEINAIPKFLHYMENDMPELLRTERYMRHVAICVEPTAAQCGIATDLMKLSVGYAKKQQLFGLTAMCSWKLPYVLASKMGFKKVREIPYEVYAKDQLMMSKRESQAYMVLAAKEGAARMMVKKL